MKSKIFGRERIDCGQFFQMADSGYGLRGQKWKISKQGLRLDVRKYWFSQQIVSTWNRLPPEVIEAQTVNTFKNRLDKCMCRDRDLTSMIASSSINTQVQVQVVAVVFPENSRKLK